MEDAKYMYEWMSNPDITQTFYMDFSKKTIDDARKFINNSLDSSSENVYFAIANDEDEYMGTVTLKNFDYKNQHVELSIVLREKAFGKGYAWFGIKAIIEKAFNDYAVDSIYWEIKRSNKRAERFFDKHHFKEAIDIPSEIKARYPSDTDIKWYMVLRDDDLEETYDQINEVEGCSIVHIRTIPTVGSGELSFFESSKEIGFDTKRVYYISKVPEGQRRGYHAHKKLKQLLFCPYGKIEIRLDDGKRHTEVTLSDPSVGILIEKPVWREMLWLIKDSVLCVAASDYYDENDYIRNYSDFQNYMGMIRR